MKEKFKAVNNWLGDFVVHAFVAGTLFIGATWCFDEARRWAWEAVNKPKVYRSY